MLKLYGFNEGIQIIAHAYPIKHLSVDSDADADLVKIYGLTWMKYLGIRVLPEWSTPRLWARDDGIMTSQSPGTKHYVPMPGVSQEAVDTR